MLGMYFLNGSYASTKLQGVSGLVTSAVVESRPSMVRKYGCGAISLASSAGETENYRPLVIIMTRVLDGAHLLEFDATTLTLLRLANFMRLAKRELCIGLLHEDWVLWEAGVVFLSELLLRV